MTKSYTYVLENIAADVLSAYVGKANDPFARFDQHINGAPNDPRSRYQRSHLTNAIKKYGRENFKLHVVEECSSEEEAFAFEHEWIVYLRSMNVHLYNKSLGGYGGQKRSTRDSTRVKMSSTHKARMQSITLRQRISSKLKGRIKSEKTRMKLSISKRRPIQQLNVDGSVHAEFDSGIDAQHITGISRSKISECCRGKRRLAGGFGWRHKP